MKLALVLMINPNDLPFLRLHLPVFKDSFDGLVCIADPAEGCEHIEYVKSQGADVIYRTFDNNWSAQFNAVIDYVENLGYQALVRLDPDELIFPRDADAIRMLLERYTILCFARYNFWVDRLHYTPGIYPDWQCRSWLLNQGIRLGGQHHEGVGWLQYDMFEGDPIADTPRQVLRVPHINLYHYGNVGRERILERDLHYVNVDREKAGHPPLDERPAERAFPTRHSIPFTGVQPLDPAVVGAVAPWSE